MNEQDSGNANGRPPSVPPASAPPSSSVPPSIPPVTDEIDSEWASEPNAAPEPPPPPPPPPPPAQAQARGPVPMHKATLIGIPAVMVPPGFDDRAEAKAAIAPAPQTPLPPAQPVEQEKEELSLEKKLSSVPPPPGGQPSSRPPASQAPISRPTPSERIDAAHDVDETMSLRPSVWPWVAVAAAALLFVGYWTMLRPQLASEASTAPTTTSEPVVPAAPAPDPVPAPAPEPTPAPSTTVEAAAATSASAAPSAAASSEPPTAAPGATVVIVTARPVDAKFYLKGAFMGTSPLRVELAPGEKRAYEVGARGYGTRKVTIDGTKPEVLVGLRRNQPAKPAQSAQP